MNLWQFFKKIWPILCLVAIGIYISFANYTPGTFLSGWDTLHPEFNLSLAFTRSLVGVFQPSQGLGVVAAHSEMADLPHIFLVALFSLIVPMPYVRYLYIFLCFLVGPLGMYLFLSQHIKSQTISFLGSLFYMLNIGTIQNFTVPYEMFVTQFALIPFFFFFTTAYLLSPTRKNLIGFIASIIFLSPTAYAATLWYVTFFVAISYISSISFLYRTFRTGFLLILLMVLLNLYWILPNLYFISHYSTTVLHALSNQLFSEEAFLYNKAFGNFQSIALLKTFYFHWSIYSNRTFVQVMQPWISHFTPFITAIGFGFFCLAALGTVAGGMKRNRLVVSLLPGLLFCLFFLFNANLPFHIYSIMQNIPLFQEAFRFPDDKILGIFVFIYSICLSFGLYSLFLFFQKLIAKTSYPAISRLLCTLCALLFVLCMFLYSLPVFQGNLIHPAMRIAIPKEYFQLFHFFQTSPYGTIATLPVDSLWGWNYYNWKGKPSFQGSGFLSFGLKQPTMDRDFDRWNAQNEAYYREISYALYAQNPHLFTVVLEKYHINYIFLDTSVIAPGYDTKILFYEKTKKLLKTIHAKQIAQFGNHLYVFKTQSPSVPLISQFTDLPQGKSVTTRVFDPDFIQKGNYLTSPTTSDITDMRGYLLSPPLTVAENQTERNLFFVLKNSTQNTCALGQDTTSKQIIQTQTTFVEYVSENGQLCDHISLTLPANTAFLIHVTSRNLSGLPLHMCISDKTSGTCIIQSKLPSSSVFATTSFLIPPFPSTHFSLDFDNIGIAPTTSINDISELSLEATSFPIPKPIRSHILPQPIFAYNNTNAFTFTPLSVPDNTTLIFAESYDPGWHLYSIQKSPWPMLNMLKQTFPFLFGKPIGQHVVVNSWENGWVLAKSSVNNNQSSLVTSQSSLVIIFLPQYLEYGGFVGGGITLLFLIVCIKYKPFNNLRRK